MRELVSVGDVLTVHICLCFDMSIAKLHDIKSLSNLIEARKS